MSDEASVKALMEQTADKFGRLDYACNSAGIQVPVAKTADADLTSFKKAIDVNLTGTWLCMKYELQQMLKQGEGGAIVNISSQDGLVGTAGLGGYTASKHAVLGITKCAALEYARDN